MGVRQQIFLLVTAVLMGLPGFSAATTTQQTGLGNAEQNTSGNSPRNPFIQ
jgi:hypothetical protein